MLTENESSQVISEVERLFAAQNKYLDEVTKSVLVEGIIKSKLPLKAVVAGLESMHKEHLKDIPLWLCLQYIESKIEKVQENQWSGKYKCQYCEDSGSIIMKSGEYNNLQTDFRIFACPCDVGARYAAIVKVPHCANLKQQSYLGKIWNYSHPGDTCLRRFFVGQ